MNCRTTSSRKKFFQRGQGLLEYALLMGFVGAIALFIFSDGSFSASIKNVLGLASDNVEAAVGYNTSDDEENSFDYETLTAEDVAPTYKTLNWQQIIFGVPGTYSTIMKSDTPDKALVSETNLFGQILSMTDGHLASTKAEDGTKDWEAMIASMERMQAEKNFSSSYSRGEESIAISRLGNSNTVQIRYTDGKEVVYWRLAPDANNVMQVQTNSNKSYNQFFAPIVNSGGWSYAK